jgi:hypothetical protein
MQVCCFHTGGPYAAEAERLRASLQRLGLDYRIDELPSRGSWDRNILITPEYIRDVMYTTRKPVLYVDADAEFHSVPEFDEGYDLQVHYLRRGDELLDGTLWLANNPVSRDVVDQWCNEVRVGEWEQLTLQRILERRPDVRVKRLAPEYCFIYDTSKALYPGVEPIIEHHQASRRLKREVPDATEPA